MVMTEWKLGEKVREGGCQLSSGPGIWLSSKGHLVKSLQFKGLSCMVHTGLWVTNSSNLALVLLL